MELWKDNWEETKERFSKWWDGKGFLIGSWLPPPSSAAYSEVENPGPAVSLEQQWSDIEWRIRHDKYVLANSSFLLDTLCVAEAWFGPGSMALYLGSEAGYSEETIWYHPVISDAEGYGKIRIDEENRWWKLLIEYIEKTKAASEGHYYTGGPDWVENWDVLSSLRGCQTLLMDMIERPGWVKEKIAEINQVWFKAYDKVHKMVRSQDGESGFGWFKLWAPGKVAKLQCDGSAMFSPAMFKEFVVSALTEQCEWLDYSMFHLDGSQCICHLDALLEIEALDAIEWTPDPRVPKGSDPCWYEMYKRILGAGKRVQVLNAQPDEIRPLLDAVGVDGLYFLCNMESEAQAEEYLRVAERVRS